MATWRQRFHSGRYPLVLCVVSLLLLWELVSFVLTSMNVSLAQSKVPYPHLILETMIIYRETLLRSLWVTGRSALMGLAVGTALGVLTALALTQSRWAERSFSPYLVASQMVPALALGPILYGILRDETLSKMAIGAYITLFSVAVNTMKGLRNVSPSSLDLMKSYAARRWQVYQFLRFPAAGPFFFTGLRIAGPLSVVGAIIVELMGSKTGLGYIILATQYFGPAQKYMLWSAILVTAGLGLFIVAVVGLLERVITPWQPEFRSRKT